MRTIEKIINRLYTKYMGLFYMSIKASASIDYRCDLGSKKNIILGVRTILYKHVTIYKAEESVLKIGCATHLAPYTYILMENQHLSIGDNVAIGPFCSIFCVSNSISKEKEILFKDSYVKGDVTIGNNVFIGAQVVILPGTHIDDHVVVASHATVKGHLESGYLYGGNPAQKIRALNG